MMVINGSAPFQINAHSFIAGPSETEYTFSYSADGINYTPYSKKHPQARHLMFLVWPSEVIAN